MRYVQPILIVLSAILVAPVWHWRNELGVDEDTLIPCMSSVIASWSIWAGLSARPLVKRLTTLVLAHLCYLATAWITDGLGKPVMLADVFVISDCVQSLVIFMTLTLCGFIAVLRTDGPAAAQKNHPHHTPFQFSLRTIFVTTALVAVLFAARLYISSPNGLIDLADLFDLELDTAFLALATTWLVLASRYIVARLVICGVVIAASTGWLIAAHNFGNVEVWPSVFVIALSALLLPFRVWGYRVTRGRNVLAALDRNSSDQTS
jgi:hypothetical protein